MLAQLQNAQARDSGAKRPLACASGFNFRQSGAVQLGSPTIRFAVVASAKTANCPTTAASHVSFGRYRLRMKFNVTLPVHRLRGTVVYRFVPRLAIPTNPDAAKEAFTQRPW